MGLSKHSNTNGSGVPSVGDPDWHNSNSRSGLPSDRGHMHIGNKAYMASYTQIQGRSRY